MPPTREKKTNARPRRPPTDEDAAADLAKAKQFFQAKDYNAASKYLMRTIWYCECNDETLHNVLRNATSKSEALAVDPANPCFCKNFLEQLRQSRGEKASPGGGGPVSTAKFGPGGVTPQNMTKLDIEGFRQALAQPCSCGSGQKPCSSEQHMSALDALVVLHRRERRPRVALDYAFRMINLAPTNARGYLRVGQVLEKDFLSAGAVDLGVRDALRCVYKHGIENVNETLPDQAEAFKQLRRQYFSLTRHDILGSLPPELASQIIQYLGVGALVRSRNVSKAWRELLGSDEKFWSHLEFGPTSSASTRQFRDSLHTWGRGKVKKLVISNATRFKFDRAKVEILCRFSGSLCHLEVYEIPRLQDTPERLKLPMFAFQNLTRLEVTHTGLESTTFRNWWVPVVKAASDALEFLSLSGLPDYATKMLPRLSRVQCLKLLGKDVASDRNYVAIDLNDLYRRVPTVQHLFLDQVDITARPSAIECPALESIVIGRRTQYFSDWPLRRLLPQSLRSFDFSVANCGPGFTGWIAHGADIPELHLEHFLLHGPCEMAPIRRFLAPSVAAGSLRSLHLPGAALDNDAMDALIKDPIAPDTVTTLGMFEYLFKNTRSYSSPFTSRPFLDLVAKYPKVTTVAAYPERFENADSAILGLINMAADADAGRPVPRIRKIYQTCLHGVARDRVLERAREVGVEIVDTDRGWMPPVFPWPRASEVEAPLDLS